MKRLTFVLLCVMCLFCASCSGQEELPTEIAGVGDVLVKENGGLLPPNPLTESDRILSANADVGTITSEMVCKWFEDVVTEAFAEQPAEEGFSICTAALSDGGIMEVMDYYGSYYSTTFRYPVQTGADSIAGAASENVERYLDRKLTDAEREELRTAVQSVVMGAGILQIQALSEYVRVSVFSEDGSIHIQCS